jgi:hypothetical protein
MAQLTISEYARQLIKAIDTIDSGKPLRIAAQSVHAIRVDRIFNKGIDGASYSTRSPIYISAKQTRRGKGGKYTNYTAFKQAIGFKGNVNLRVTNDLQMDFANSSKDSGTGAASVGEVIKVNNGLFIEEIRSAENVKKLNGNIKRFGNFIEFTNEEKKTFDTVLEQEIIKILTI